MLTRSRLKEVLNYDPNTGEFRWAVGRIGASKGNLAGTIVSGYRAIKIDRKRYLAHRLAFLFMIGKMPAEVDHVNRNKDDNRWVNLRPTTRSQNHANAGMHSLNTSGVKGVTWHKGGACWWAYINWQGSRFSLGHHKTLRAAKQARRAAERKYFGEFRATA